MSNQWYVYIIECLDGSLYTGISTDPEERFETHKQGKGGKYTASHGVRRLAYIEEAESKGAALRRELEIKRWRREEKLRLIDNNR